jgi:formate hydrogenlyase transcriptional activator
MSTLPEVAEALSTNRKYSTLLEVAEAIVTHRDLRALFHDLAGPLHRVVHFDYLALVLHDAKIGMMRLHVLESSPPPPVMRLHVLESTEPSPPPPAEGRLSTEDDPPWLVWQNQLPLTISNVEEDPHLTVEFRERAKQYRVSSSCYLPLTTARCRLGVLVFASMQPAAYDTADVDFLQRVAKQVTVAVENALAFQQIEELKEKLTQEKVYLEEEIRTQHNFDEIVGNSDSLRRVLQEVETVAPTDSTVLIRGETGTGKELVARAIHDLNHRRDRTFVKLNCAAIPTGLLESELFGHEKGAFTGAIAQKLGRFELAHEGTLFLDEVGDISPELQPKLLRVLQEQEFERLGGTRTIKVNVRLVAATHRDLAQMVAAGQFRSDLFYRLNVFPVLLPPLRERRDDIPQLVRHFIQKFARRMGRRIETIPTEAMDALAGYPWPGNIRELENVIERAVILSAGSALRLPPGEWKAPLPPVEVSATAPVTLADAERQHIIGVLHETDWVVGGSKGAAARLGMKRTTLQKKMNKLGISRPE